jgi:hypothetical protein
MTPRKGELPPATIDRQWPHQVALPADQLKGANNAVIHEFCGGLSLCPRNHTVHRDDVAYVVFCFADASHAERFRERFGGERFDPKDRGRGCAWFLWRKRQP